jgi:hypothetical protein
VLLADQLLPSAMVLGKPCLLSHLLQDVTDNPTAKRAAGIETAA